MATKGKRAASQPWTQEKQDAATKGRYYIKLGDKRGQLLLSGAAKKWQTDPSFAYVPSLRVAGTPEDIERVLGEDAREHLRQAYTGASAAGAMKSQYESELADLKSGGRKGGKKAASRAPTLSISRYAAMVDEATVKGAAPRSPSKSPKRSGSPKRAGKSPKRGGKSPKRAGKSPKRAGKSPKRAGRKSAASPGAKRGARPLAEKLAKLAEGKVMDVSALRADGSGAKTTKAPTDRSKKILATGYPIVSDNKTGINAAARQLEDPALVEAWVEARGRKANEGGARGRKANEGGARSRSASREASPARSRSASREASPARSRTASRSGSAAATLPMSPIGIPQLPVVRTSPRGGLALPSLPSVRAGSIGSPRSPRSPRL